MSKDNLKKHLDHIFYQDAESYRRGVRFGQIKKGSEKYPEPFTTASWTNDEIVEHAMQENVDQSHYIYACKERMDEQEKEIERLRQALREIAYNESIQRSESWQERAIEALEEKR